jgi:hypothetical protein
MENRPRISRWIGGGYAVLTLFLVILFAWISSLPASGIFYAELLQWVVAVVIPLLLLIVTFSFFRTKYTIENGKLHSWSPFAVIDLRTKDIAKAQRTLIPFSFKGFGASAYSGWFFVPTVGWTRVIITNLSDGVLLKSKDGRNYLITPSRPDSFIKSLKSR